MAILQNVMYTNIICKIDASSGSTVFSLENLLFLHAGPGHDECGKHDKCSKFSSYKFTQR